MKLPGIHTSQPGGYYQSIRQTFLLHTLLWPLLPMLLVSGFIVLLYDTQFTALLDAVQGGAVRVDAAAERLFWVRLAAFGAIAVAMVLVALKARSLSQAMAERIAHTAKLASIGELAAGVAHEINNPIAVMIEEAGWVSDLLDEVDLRDADKEQELRRALEQIRVQGGRCKEITRKLLNFARQGEDDATELDINRLLDDLLSVINRRAAQRGVRVHADIAPALPPVTASHGEVQQVLFNLINNAFDAMDPEGGDLHIAARREGDEVLMEVRDTGVGIPSEQLQNVFDPFYTTKPVGTGTGLGLSICYGLVRRWGGRIRVESKVGQGTRIWFSMPLKKQEGKEPATPGAQCEPSAAQSATETGNGKPQREE